MISFGLARTWKPSRNELFSAVRAPDFRRLRLDRFPRGIDNVHVDVVLEDEFFAAARNLVRCLLHQDVARHLWQEPQQSKDKETEGVFRSIYVRLSDQVVKQARALSQPQRVQLFQLAVLKLLFALVDRELVNLRSELDEALAQPARQHSGQCLRVYDRKVLLSRYSGSVRYRCASELMRLVMRLETSVVRKARKTLLGVSWPLSPDIFENPFLLLGGVGPAEDFASCFPMALRDPQQAHSLCNMVVQALKPWLIDQSHPVMEDLGVGPGGNSVKVRHDQGGLAGYVEVEQRCEQAISKGELQVPAQVLDSPVAVRQLLGGTEVGWPMEAPWGDERFPRFQKQLVASIGSVLRKAGLREVVTASYLMQQVFPVLGVRDGAEPIFDYLADRLKRKELVRRLTGLGIQEVEAVVDRLDTLVANRRASEGDQAWPRAVVRFVSDCMAYRYQLKTALWCFHGMDGLRLLFDRQDREMSTANGLCQVFTQEAMQDGVGSQVIGHVVIKADVRGSTAITAEMRDRNLNPAAYFSRNLYDPINALLRTFGAEKVFIEGDAVILAIMEYGSTRTQNLAVARACGLAQRVLALVQAKNAESKRLGLPMLELGVGIAYSDEAPTYLYDEGHRIMISPAINRADRLSSCDGRVRALLTEQNGPRHGVEVVARSGSIGNEDFEFLRFNVNGIELEPPAVSQLRSELKLRRVELPDERGQFLVGRYPDSRGVTHWLMLRDAPTRLWMGNELIETALQGHRYVEVVTDKELRLRLKHAVVRRNMHVDNDSIQRASG